MAAIGPSGQAAWKDHDQDEIVPVAEVHELGFAFSTPEVLSFRWRLFIIFLRKVNHALDLVGLELFLGIEDTFKPPRDRVKLLLSLRCWT
jgi:hypothetical protein